MHELSIAQALLNSLDAHAPRGATVSAVHVSVGPLQAIDKDAMRFAWRAATEHTKHDGVALHLRQLPYRWNCTTCGKQWESDDLFQPCACGNTKPDWVGGDELLIDSLEVTDERAAS